MLYLVGIEPDTWYLTLDFSHLCLHHIWTEAWDGELSNFAFAYTAQMIFSELFRWASSTFQSSHNPLSVSQYVGDFNSSFRGLRLPMTLKELREWHVSTCNPGIASFYVCNDEIVWWYCWGVSCYHDWGNKQNGCCYIASMTQKIRSYHFQCFCL